MKNPPIKVLLIDDNPGEALLFKTLLNRIGSDGFILVHEDSLAAGLEHLRTYDLDVVLLDLNLPDSQGFQTVKEVKTRFDHLPIILLTGLDDQSLALHAVRDGAQDYILKQHVDGYLLNRSIRYAIERQRSEEALAWRNKELTLLHEFSERVGQSLELAEVLDRALEELLSLEFLDQERERGAIFLMESQPERLQVAVSRGLPEDLPCLQRSVKVGECLCGLAAEKEEIIIAGFDDPDGHHAFRSLQMPCHRNVCVPMELHDEVIGVFTLWVDEDREVIKTEKRIFKAIARQIAMAVENARLYEEARRQALELNSLNRAAQIITAVLDLESVLRLIVEEVRDRLSVDGVSILLREPATKELVFAACAGRAAEEIEGTRMPASEGIAGWVLRAGQPILVDNVQAHPKHY